MMLVNVRDEAVQATEDTVTSASCRFLRKEIGDSVWPQYLLAVGIETKLQICLELGLSYNNSPKILPPLFSVNRDVEFFSWHRRQRLKLGSDQ